MIVLNSVVYVSLTFPLFILISIQQIAGYKIVPFEIIFTLSILKATFP